MKNLNDYNIIPTEKMKRKLDYFYLPYNPLHNNQKYMDFRNCELQKEWEKFKVQEKNPKPIIKVPPKVKFGKLYRDKGAKEEEDLIETSHQISNDLWSRFKDKIFQTD